MDHQKTDAYDANEYLERHHIRELLESIVTGMTYSKPRDPLHYMEDCIQKIRDTQVSNQVKWHTFLPPITRRYEITTQDYIVRRTEPIPALYPLKAKAIEYPVLGTYQTLPSIQQNEPKKKTKAWKNIVFVLGGPGSGKGTQCKRLAAEFNYVHLSVGELLRDEVQKETPAGKEIDGLMKQGAIIPMHMTLRLLLDAMKQCDDKEGFLIDGFPRQLDQAIEFEQKYGKPRLVLYFDCHANVLERRLLRRAQSSGRADDNAETIKKRLDVFYQTSFPVIQHYVKNQRCYSVSGEGTEEEVYQETQRAFSRRPLYHSNIVFVLGAPLSGKGTQCSKLADDFGLVHLSTGDLLREEVAGKTDIGLEVEGMMKEGKLVPSEYLVEMLRDRVARNMKAPGFLIDGYPLTMDQIGEFEAKIGPCRAVLAFKCPVQVLEERLVERSKTSGREDDNLDTMRKRITTFETQSLPVIDYFKKQGKCLEVSSEQTVEQVYEESKSLFKKPIRIDHPNVIFVLGNVGSGKGTQCSYIVQEFGFKHISTGDLLRNEVKQQTPIGRMVEQYMNQGQMAPSSVILTLLKNEISKSYHYPGILIDGFPRTMDQVLEFERTIGSPRQVISYECPLDILLERLVERGKTSGRADDNLETIKKRFRIFEQESLPVIQYFERKNALLKISSIPLPEQVYKNLLSQFPLKAPSLPYDNLKIYFVLGGPGSGKGTQCARLAEKHGLVHISTGDMLREEVSNGTAVGRKAESLMIEGKMIPIELMMEIIKCKLDSLVLQGVSGVLLDGYPRTLEQARLFETTCTRAAFALYFKADTNVLIDRLLQRGMTSGRADDNMESIKKRLRVYETESYPVIQYFAQQGRVREIDSNQHVDKVTLQTESFFEQ